MFPKYFNSLKIDSSFAGKWLPDVVPRAAGARSSESEVRALLDFLTPKPTDLELDRIGGVADGAYLVPDVLDGVVACFSPGTNNFKSFEDDLFVRHRIKSYMCDYSSDAAKLKTPIIDGFQFFQKKWLEPECDDISTSLDEWIRSSEPGNHDLLLQMDIEGAEYRNLIAASDESINRFRVIVIEIHQLDRLADAMFVDLVFSPFLKKLQNFVCVHAHPNNCCGEVTLWPGVVVPRILELTLVRADFYVPSRDGRSVVLPNELDVVNVLERPPLHLTGALARHSDTRLSNLARMNADLSWFKRAYSAQQSLLFDLDARVKTLEAFVALQSRHRNLALGKVASQSSRSVHSTAGDSTGATNGMKTGRFGFHTDEEMDPWWCVDLGAVCVLDSLVIYNRVDAGQQRAEAMSIFFGETSDRMVKMYDHPVGRPIGGVRPFRGRGPLMLDVKGARARFIRIALRGRSVLHLDQVEVYGVSAGVAVDQGV